MGRLRTVAIWILLVAVVCGLSFALEGEDLPDQVLPVATVGAEIGQGRVASVAFQDGATVVTRVDGTRYQVDGYLDENTYEAITDAGIPVTLDEGGTSSFVTVIVVLVPLALLLLALVYFVRRQQQGNNANIFSMRRSTARLVKSGTETLRFSDVGGATEAKERLADVVDYLKNPKRWTDAGVRIPRGVLLEGPPGCGKTLLARAVAGEAGVPVHVVSASEFVEMFVGVGAARVRDLFETAAKNAPAVIFIDELDAVGRRRGSGIGASHDEREQTLNQLLVNLDGFEKAPRVVVIAATNRADVLDSALLRPGRFDVRVLIPPPDVAARREVLDIHLRGKKLAQDVSMDTLVARTEGLSGADLEHLCNEAAMAAVRRTRDGGVPFLTAADFDAVLAARTRASAGFDRVDQLLLDSASQLARPGGPTHVHLVLLDGVELEGELVWADATFLKVAPVDGDARIVPKAQLKSLRSRSGTGAVGVDEVVGDRWAGRRADMA